ncbi:MAG: hypothetical protein GY830_06930 [Bacteroidetes bacterium]|nr:hypothetical protein [Bacteroidota bacterium]
MKYLYNKINKQSNILRYINYAIIFMMTIVFYNCRIYSFVTSSLPKEVKSFTIKPIFCRVAKPEAFIINDRITYLLKTKLKSINLSPKDKGDIKFEGEIVDYQLKRIGKISEISVSMYVIYKNYEGKDEKIPITKQRKLSEGEVEPNSKVLNEIADEIVEEIWNKTVSKW